MAAPELLRDQWSRSGDRLANRLVGLSDEEAYWRPAPECWTVRRDAAAPSGWQIDHPFPPPDPPPLTTLIWRLVHLTNGNRIYWDHAVGPGQLTFLDLHVADTAAAAVTAWQESRSPITAWLAVASDRALRMERPSHLGGSRPMSWVLATLLDEQTHHGAEIALLRDLWRVGLR